MLTHEIGQKFGRLLTGGLVAAGLTVAGAGQGHAASFAGHWKVVINAVCANSPQNAKVCGQVFGQLKGVGVPGTTLSERFTVKPTVAANGSYTASGSGYINESGTKASVHSCPSPSKFGNVIYTGTCPFSSTYQGHIANSKYGIPVFYDATYTLTFNGKKMGTFKDDHSGLPSPARVGTYSAAWAAHVSGAKTASPGFGFSEVVTH
jgi:hypothetical protein